MNIKHKNDRINISKVASEAGTSIKTVSRVLNNRPDVAPETRQRVQDVIARLGYQPSALARSLVSRRTHTLGLINADFNDENFAKIVAGAEVEARRRGYFFILGSTERNPEGKAEYVRLLTERHVEGMLFTRPGPEANHSRSSSEHDLIDMRRAGVPVVTIMAYHVPGETLTAVDVNNVEGGQLATRCLLDSGHRAVAMIMGPKSFKSTTDRTHGYVLALEAAGIELDSRLIVEGDWSYASGYQATQALLASGQPLSALFAQNDRMAMGAIRALREAGRHVPQDVAVVGYDDVPGAEYFDPPLTTIRQPFREMGAVATRLLIQTVEEPNSVHSEVLLKPELVRRHSCP